MITVAGKYVGRGQGGYEGKQKAKRYPYEYVEKERV